MQGKVSHYGEGCSVSWACMLRGHLSDTESGVAALNESGVAALNSTEFRYESFIKADL